MKTGRRQEILEVLARELELRPGSRITTANLAAAVGVSEAALYRHFPSKAKMFDALIDFAEEAVFGLVNRILEEDRQCPARCARIASMVLLFAERNAGITRVLMGDILVGENERLRARVAQFFDRLETQFRQILRDGVLTRDLQPDRAEIHSAANLLLVTLSGRLGQFVRSGYRVSPYAGWDGLWPVLARGIFSVHPGREDAGPQAVI